MVSQSDPIRNGQHTLKGSETTRAIGLLLLALATQPSGLPAGLKDSESASHGDEAASYQLIKTYDYADFKVHQFQLGVLSHYSYMLVSGGEALVVDPGRDASVYPETAKKEGATIKGVYLTHSHADFVAGHRELAEAVKCPIHVNAASKAEYAHEPLKDGSIIKVGKAIVKVIETPGHTPDGTCGVIGAAGQPDRPLVILTGDTLFIGSVGRPDLLEGTMSAAQLASMGYDTWTQKLSKLPDDAVVLPAHGAGSLCGAHLRDEPSSTIGTERTSNPYLQHKSRSDYIAAVLEGLPEAPQYFGHNAAMNRTGPKLVDWNAPLKEAKAEAALSGVSKGYVVDLRGADEYASGHIPNAVNIGLRGRLETWVGIMIPWGADLVLCGAPEELKEAVYRLHRVGYDSVRVVPMDAWQEAKLPLVKNEMVKPTDLHRQMQDGTAPIVLDVRLPTEWMGLRIGNVVNLPLSKLDELSGKLDSSQPVVAVCNSAYRSSMAVGVLERKGFTKASGMDGGSEAWIGAGLPVYQAAKSGAVAAAPKRDIRLAERMSADALKRLIMDLPGTFDLLDIRPPEQFADYSLPASRNVDIADALSNAAYLTGTGSLIIIDRDGSLAMMVAGILSQKTQRSIKALHGGLQAYWEATEMKGAVRAVPIPGAGGGAAPPGARPLPSAPSTPSAPQTPKKKSAGC